jgi:hypothetical protein
MRRTEPKHANRQWMLWGLVALFFVLRFHLLLVRVYDPDEFEHLHAGWNISQGMVPYRDFFEHHGPVTYGISAGLFRLLPYSVDPLHAHRCLSLVISILTAVGIACLAKRLYGRSSAPWCVLLAMTYSLFVEKSVEWRPDVIATSLVVWVAWLAVGRLRFSAGLLAGILTSLALFTTQKSLFVLAGLLLASLMGRSASVGAKVRWIVGVAVGGLGVAGLLAGIFAVEGGLMPAIDSLLFRPMQWSLRISGPNPLLSPFAFAPGHQVGLLAAWVGLLAQLGRRSSWRRGRFVLPAGIVAHGVGYFIAPAVYLQFYMLVVPIAAVMIGGELYRLIRHARRDRCSALLGIVWLLLGIVWLYAGIFGWMGPTPLMPRGSVDGSRILPYFVLPLAGWGMLLLGAILRSRGAVAGGQGMLLAVLLLPPITQIGFTHFFWPNKLQRKDIATLEQLVPADGLIVDGFSGLGFRRPHLSYWWWINEHTIPMILQQGDDRPILTDIAMGKPAAILFDRDLQRLPGLQEIIARHYEMYDLSADGQGGRPYVILLRRDLFSKGR